MYLIFTVLIFPTANLKETSHVKKKTCEALNEVRKYWGQSQESLFPNSSLEENGGGRGFVNNHITMQQCCSAAC